MESDTTHKLVVPTIGDMVPVWWAFFWRMSLGGLLLMIVAQLLITFIFRGLFISSHEYGLIIFFAVFVTLIQVIGGVALSLYMLRHALTKVEYKKFKISFLSK